MVINEVFGFGEIVELNIESFSLVEDVIKESGLIFEAFVGGEGDSLDLLRYKLLRNKAKIFVMYVAKDIISYSILFSKRSTVSKISYDWHLAYVYVDKTFRRNKIGEKMLCHILDFTSKTKANELSLYASEDNFPAIKLYRKFKFQENRFIANYIWFKYNLNLIRKKRDL